MPLLTSPIDGSPMKQINRFGIEIDICPTSGGVWLDKGELEKIILMIKEAAEEERQAAMPMSSAQPRQEYARPVQTHYRDDDDDYRKREYSGYDKHKKKSKFSMLSDLFDF